MKKIILLAGVLLSFALHSQSTEKMNIVKTNVTAYAFKNQCLDIPLVKYTVTLNANGAAMKLDGQWAGLRSGLAIGCRF